MIDYVLQEQMKIEEYNVCFRMISLTAWLWVSVRTVNWS